MPGFFTGSKGMDSAKTLSIRVSAQGLLCNALPEHFLAVVRTAGFKTAGMRLLLAVSERRFRISLSPQQWRQGTAATAGNAWETLRSIVSCAVCPPASFYARIPRRRPQGAGRSRIHAQVAPPRERERAEALLHVHRPRRRVRRARAFLRRKIPLS